MDDKTFYTEVYHILGSETPLRFDCGRLCGAVCCKVSADQPGMYLFPGEDALYAGLGGFTICDVDLPGYGPVKLLNCPGSCDRSMRPLSCRIFPLAPKITGDSVAVRQDPRGRAACPLCRRDVSGLSGSFTASVGHALERLMANPEARQFIIALSMHLDEFGNQHL